MTDQTVFYAVCTIVGISGWFFYFLAFKGDKQR